MKQAIAATKHAALFMVIEDDRGNTTYGCVRIRDECEDLWRLIKLRRTDSHIEAVYDVQSVGSGWTCDCPAGTMRPGRGDCRHIRALKEVGVIG